jgi:hypothetical protein
MVPIGFIQSTINTLKLDAISNVRKNISVNQRDINVYIRSELIRLIEKTIGKMVNKSLYAGLYKEYIFNTFAIELYRVVSSVISRPTSSASYNTVTSITNKSDAHKYTTFLNIGVLTEFIRTHDVTSMNPHTLLDLFDISELEIENCLGQLIHVKYNINSNDLTPKFYNLNLDESKYLDKTSLSIANTIFISKLTVMVTALLILTKDSIIPSSRKKYIDSIYSNIDSVERFAVNDVTRSMGNIFKSLRFQINELRTLSKDSIKLNKIIFNGHTVI